MFVQLLLNGVATGSIYALVAVALGIIYRTCRYIDFAQAACFAVAAYIALYASTSLSLPLSVSVSLGAIVVSALAALYHTVVIAPLKRRNAARSVLLLASMGVFVVMEAIVVMLCGAEARSFSALSPSQGVMIVGGRWTSVQIVSILTSFVVVTIWVAAEKMTKVGMLWHALASNPSLAEVVGVRRDNASRLAIMAAALTAGLAGCLQACDTGLSPSMGFGTVLSALVAIVIGGKSTLGTAFVAGLLAVLQQASVLIVATNWQDALVFLILITVLLLRPGGQHSGTALR